MGHPTINSKRKQAARMGHLLIFSNNVLVSPYGSSER